uniref:Uncharacterized protein n=1 Tax=Tetranychus urticae TaxID=32264 RepID=T1K889_TETUR
MVTSNINLKNARLASSRSYTLFPGNLSQGEPRKFKPTFINGSMRQLTSKKYQLKASSFFWIKFVSWLIASVGLFWQISSVSMIYFRFPTRTDIEIDSPRNVNMPGLTICLKLITPSTQIVPTSSAISLYNQTVGPLSNNLRYVPINILSKLPHEPVEITCKTPWPELVPINSSAGDDCENFVTPIETIQYDYEEDQLYRCTTYFHQRPNKSEINVITKNSEHFYRVNFQTSQNYWIAVYVHNPVEVLHLNEADTFRFSTKETEQITLMTTKMTTYLSRYPYQTDCIDYEEQVYGRMSCVYNCRCAMVRKVCPIWPYDVPADPKKSLPFFVSSKSCQTPGRYLCSIKSTCKNACLNKWYSTSLINRKEKSNSSNLTKFYVRRPFGAEVNYYYTARMERIEFFCYIASCFGTWLGISFADLIKFSGNWFEKQSIEKSRVNIIKVAAVKLPSKSFKIKSK